MERLGILVVLTVLAIVVSLLLQRRRPEAPSAPSYRAPGQVDLADFVSRPTSGEVLIVVFSSTSCDGCIGVWKTLSELKTTGVQIQRIEVEDDPSLHKRYKIDGVPTTLVIDSEGIVTKSFFGLVTRSEIQTHLPH